MRCSLTSRLSLSFSVISRSITRPLLPDVVAWPTAELHAGEFSDVAEAGEGAGLLEGLGVSPFGCSESAFGVWMFSALVLRKPFWIGLSSPGEGVTGVVPFDGVPKGWKPFIASFGNSSIRRLDFRRP